MTKENFNIAKDILAQIQKLENIERRIQKTYNASDDTELKELLSDCMNVCEGYKDYKEKRFSEL